MSKSKESAKTEKSDSVSKVKLVKMTRGDVVANVHPDEVKSYLKAGYSE